MSKSAPSTERSARDWKAVMELARSSGACRAKKCQFNICRIAQIAKRHLRKR